jgi:hypothetical protein
MEEVTMQVVRTRFRVGSERANRPSNVADHLGVATIPFISGSEPRAYAWANTLPEDSCRLK